MKDFENLEKNSISAIKKIVLGIEENSKGDSGPFKRV